jgi:hypothetical protein
MANSVSMVEIPGFVLPQAVAETVFCHPEFISGSHAVVTIRIHKILNQVQNDNLPCALIAT